MLTTPSILLRSHDVGEAHRIYTFYTRDHGKVDALATGVRKTASKFAGHLTSESIVSCTFHLGGERARLIDARREKQFPMLREHAARAEAAHVGRETLDVLTRPGLSDPRLFDLLARLFERLDAPDADPALLMRLYLHRLLDALGLQTMPKSIDRGMPIASLIDMHLSRPLVTAFSGVELST